MAVLRSHGPNPKIYNTKKKKEKRKKSDELTKGLKEMSEPKGLPFFDSFPFSHVHLFLSMLLVVGFTFFFSNVNTKYMEGLRPSFYITLITRAREHAPSTQNLERYNFLLPFFFFFFLFFFFLK